MVSNAFLVQYWSRQKEPTPKVILLGQEFAPTQNMEAKRIEKDYIIQFSYLFVNTLFFITIIIVITVTCIQAEWLSMPQQ